MKTYCMQISQDRKRVHKGTLEGSARFEKFLLWHRSNCKAKIFPHKAMVQNHALVLLLLTNGPYFIIKNS